MKSWLFTLLLLGLTLGCKQTVDPTDPLYRTWRWTQIEYNDGRIVSLTPSESSIVSFLPNGMILYGANGRYAACCLPNRFRRDGNTLDFVKVDAVPVPPVDDAEKCTLVDCQLQGNSWEILTLTETKLVLKTPFGNYTYVPYP